MPQRRARNLSRDPLASRGAWLRDIESGAEFLDFSGTWHGWGFGHGFVDYSWNDFVSTIAQHASRAVSWPSPNLDVPLQLEVRPVKSDWLYIDSALPIADVLTTIGAAAPQVVIGGPEDKAPKYMSESWLSTLSTHCTERKIPLCLNETKTFLTVTEGLWTQRYESLSNFGSVISIGSGLALQTKQCIGQRTSSEEPAPLNLYRELYPHLDVHQIDNLDELSAYFDRVFKEVLLEFDAVEFLGATGLSLWCRVTHQSLRDLIVDTAFQEGLLVGEFGETGFSLHAPGQVKADAVGRAAAQLEAGLRKAFQDIDRWI